MSTEIKYFKEIEVDLIETATSTKRKPNSFIHSAVKENILLRDPILRIHPITIKKTVHPYIFAIYNSNHGLVIVHNDEEFKFITNKTSQDLMDFRASSRMNRPLFSLRKVKQRGTQ